MHPRSAPTTQADAMKHAGKLALLALAATLISTAPVPRDKKVSVSTAYMLEPLQVEGLNKAHRVGITGTLGGGGNLVLDPNACSLNEFGDPTICTQMAIMPLVFRFQRVDVEDPLKLGRTLYELRGVPSTDKLFLVVPRRPSEEFRLLRRNSDELLVDLVTLETDKP